MNRNFGKNFCNGTNNGKNGSFSSSFNSGSAPSRNNLRGSKVFGRTFFYFVFVVFIMTGAFISGFFGGWFSSYIKNRSGFGGNGLMVPLNNSAVEDDSGEHVACVKDTERGNFAAIYKKSVSCCCGGYCS